MKSAATSSTNRPRQCSSSANWAGAREDQGLSAKSSLFSFFGKVIDKTEPKEFERADGEKGGVATLLLGDETGTTRVVLWDEKAGAVLYIAAGDVTLLSARTRGKSTREIYALALRKASPPDYLPRSS